MWIRRLVVYGTLLALFGLVVPDASHAPTRYELLHLEGVSGIDASDHVVWILALGSDARPGQPSLGSRSDAIQLVGINAVTHRAIIIGIPRDSYVDIPGYGRDKINAAMVYGGPEETAKTVAAFLGIQPDYVFTTTFPGLKRMVGGIHGITAKVTYNMDDMGQVFHPGMHTFTGKEALAFARIRHGLPAGDFDRSMDQGQLLKGGLSTVLGKLGRAGFLERALSTFARYTETNTNPVDLYRLARTVLQVNPKRVRDCVLKGGTGYVGSASVVFPDTGAARALVHDVRHDAKLDSGC